MRSMFLSLLRDFLLAVVAAWLVSLIPSPQELFRRLTRRERRGLTGSAEIRTDVSGQLTTTPAIIRGASAHAGSSATMGLTAGR